MTPKDVYILIPRTCENVALCGKSVFASVIKVTNLEIGS